MKLVSVDSLSNQEAVASSAPSFLEHGLVGMDSRLEELNSLIGVGSDDVRVVGICGMGGIGKTSIAKAYSNWMSSKFEGKAFLANVREVSSKGQLQNLAGKRNWFGSGSRIIITTRNEHLLISHGVDEIYKAKGLNHSEALQLFSLKAFKNSQPLKDNIVLSTKIVHYANGLPLALEVLGSFLFNKTLDEWRSALNKMKENPEHEILDTLQLSFDGLEDMEKQIFLDIACFFKGKKKDHTTKRLEGCGFYPDIGLKVLIEKSLITVVGEEKLWMHDLLQEMGWKIVRQESPDEPGKRSRLWLCKDIFHVLTKNTGTNDVEGMVLDLLEPEEMQLDAKAFLKLKKMRLLFFRNVHFSHSLEYLSNELRFLKWHGYGFKELPCSFQAKELVELNMCYSQVEQLWKGTKQFNKLQIMKLSHSKNLINTPDFRGLPNIEKLILEGCDELLEIDQSIGVLERLVLLNLKDCRKLSSLPESIYCLKALKILNLSGCIVLDYMLEELGNMKSLEELDVSMTTINQPTSSFSQFKNLKILSLRGCTGRPQPIWKSQSSLLQANSSNASDLYSLMVLDLSNCNLQEETIPSDLSCLSSLTELYLSGNSFSSLPASICRLTKLENLYLDNCGNLQSLQAIPSNVKLLSAQACSALETLPETFDLSGLQSPRFNFTNCFKLAASNQACNNVAFMILRNYLQGLSNPKSGFDIIVPGSHVPDWLTHQSSGESSISIELPPVWSDSIGFAICAVFVIYPEPLLNFMDLDLTCCIKIRGHTYRHELDYSFIEMELVGSDQLWLFYLPRNEFLDIDCRKDVAEVGSHAEVMFTAHGVGLHVKTFGVRVIYEQDVMMFNQKMSQICSSTTHENLNVLHVDNDMAKPVRKSSGEEEPEPKRLKKD